VFYPGVETQCLALEFSVDGHTSLGTYTVALPIRVAQRLRSGENMYQGIAVHVSRRIETPGPAAIEDTGAPVNSSSIGRGRNSGDARP